MSERLTDEERPGALDAMVRDYVSESEELHMGLIGRRPAQVVCRMAMRIGDLLADVEGLAKLRQADAYDSHMRAAEAETARAERDALKAEVEESDATRERLADILTRTAIALRGEPEPLCSHGWADLPGRAALLKASNDEAHAVIERQNLEVSRLMDAADDAPLAMAELETEVERLTAEIRLITAPLEAGGGYASLARLDERRKIEREIVGPIVRLLKRCTLAVTTQQDVLEADALRDMQDEAERWSRENGAEVKP